MSAVAERLLTLDEFYRQFEGRRAYLIDGVPYEMTPPNPPHSTAVTALATALRRVVPAGCHVRTENPLETGGPNDPEPDIAVLSGDEYAYTGRHPTAGDALLVVEVSDSTLATDRRRKLPKYAESSVQEVWIVNLGAGVVEVCRSPDEGRYTSVRSYQRGESIAPLFASDAEVLVDRWVGR